MKLTQKEKQALVNKIVTAKVEARTQAAKFDAAQTKSEMDALKFDFIWSQARSHTLDWLLFDLMRDTDSDSVRAVYFEVNHRVNAVTDALEQVRQATLAEEAA